MSIICDHNIPNNVKMESKPCPLGCPPGDKLLLIGRDRLNNLPGEFKVVRCKTCRLIRTDPRPTQDTIAFYYPDSYEPWALKTSISTSSKIK